MNGAARNRIVLFYFSEQAMDGRPRQPDHVRPGAVDPFDEPGGAALDGIPAGLALRFTGRDVPLDLLGRHRPEAHAGRDDPRLSW